MTRADRRLWVLGALAWAGCGTETGNPEGLTAELAYNARSSEPSEVGLDEGSPVVVESVWLRLDAVQAEGCDGSVERLPGVGWADHGTAGAADQQLSLEASSLCALGTVAEPEPGAVGEPAAVAGASVALEGHLADGRPFVVRWDDTEWLGVELEGLQAPTEGRWLMTFDVAEWLDAEAMWALSDEELLGGSPLVARAVSRPLADGVSLSLDLDFDGQVSEGDELLSAP